jgi:hypothetical protein
MCYNQLEYNTSLCAHFIRMQTIWLHDTHTASTYSRRDVITNKGVMRNIDNMISRLTRSLQHAGSMGDFENRDKTYKVVQALHPGCFAKDTDEGKLSDVCEVGKAALLELSFCWAVHAICRVEIGW